MRYFFVSSLVAACLLSPTAFAASVSALVKDHKGKPLKDAVVTVYLSGNQKTKVQPAKTAIDQIDKEFVPHVLVVKKGSPVFFPNKDDIRHHVYSFSKPKKFELPLYKGTPAKPVVFDKSGVVKLGCNIHDWMLGYIYIVDTEHYGVTDKAGKSQVVGLPAGDVKIMVWHPRMKGAPEKTVKQVKLSASGGNSVEFQIKARKAFRARRAPRAGGRKY